MMKKRWMSLLLLALVVIFAGCQATDPADRETTEPPCLIVLHSYEEYEALMQALQLSDADVEAYLSANAFSMNGVSNRQELLALLSELDAIPFPQVFGARMLWLDYNPELGERSVLFRYPDDSGLVISNLPEDFLLEKLEWEEITEQIQPVALEKVYQSKASDDLFLAQSDRHMFLIRFFDLEEQNPIAILQELYFEP